MMKAVGIAVVMLCLAVGGAFVAYLIKYPAYTHRIKAFIEIEDGGELRTGSGEGTAQNDQSKLHFDNAPLFGATRKLRCMRDTLRNAFAELTRFRALRLSAIA